ncbi:5-oxoprolinase subunit PxpB [Rodentibacter pneumotropicus]|uniref:5-oxoprolinase subunit PxpB n=1 Tax=Rodentibacter pneumotropicus TaxID=758 RepID=A0A4S2PD95_9PAST|nr:5-oxoprolinase subunit PxpB [Rodentibacter pneumotropicus]TGZ98483.1 5-oxoprolinase subunit PxpB [Rodentibacter pneumotropicus]THA01238.1 5-oxoprolinase subunit PxpB [Rodentibacter pneumotropicus]THA08884.1 5-oxoprolinase subunit PxpB [Rodentibacter pneumotropicus]THA14597.1 5-oxoprolinase subunit PxpB [Rodentibacter pneumotropicus]
MLTIHHTSEYSLICSLPPPAELSKQQSLWQLAELAQNLSNVVESVVGMNNLTLFYHLHTDPLALINEVHQLWENVQTQKTHFQGKLVEIPVHYGGEFGEDLYDVAKFHHTTAQEIIHRHTAPTYTVFMMGFQPGFPYLGGLPESLHTPRRDAPRTRVPAGSVGIGGSQTGIYPFTSPGGWQLLGKTDIQLFDVNQSQPVLLKAGDQIRFVVKEMTL